MVFASSKPRMFPFRSLLNIISEFLTDTTNALRLTHACNAGLYTCVPNPK